MLQGLPSTLAEPSLPPDLTDRFCIVIQQLLQIYNEAFNVLYEVMLFRCGEVGFEGQRNLFRKSRPFFNQKKAIVNMGVLALLVSAVLAYECIKGAAGVDTEFVGLAETVLA